MKVSTSTQCSQQCETRCNLCWFSCPLAGSGWGIHWERHPKICEAQGDVGLVLLPQIFGILPLFLLKLYFFRALVQPPPSLLPGTWVLVLFLSSFWLEGRQKKNKLINSSLKNHYLRRNCATSSSVPVGLPSAEPHAEITVFKLFRKAIEKQTSVSLGGSVYTLALLPLGNHG